MSPTPVGPATLITPDGLFQFTRVFYHNGKYSCGERGDRLGMASLILAELSDDKGVIVTFSTGHKVFIPRTWFMYTWVP